MLKDQVCIVTGGCGLLGKEFVAAILNAGGRAVIADVDTVEGEIQCAKLAALYGAGRVIFCQMDICSKESIQKTIRLVAGQFGRIDALVNNAYPRNKQYGRKLEDVTYTDFCENISINLGGLFLTSQQFALFFQKQNFGNIINISSIYGTVVPRFEIYEGTSMTMPVEYAAIKSAVIHLTKYFAKYFRGFNLRANCISPGGIKDSQPESFLDRYASYAINKGMLDKQDLSGVLLFLLSDLSSYVNGQNIIVDDGWSL
jgi:NAD(P)-dependent dehydrogenase (short-subunit alcohol dehydrogenase family)